MTSGPEKDSGAGFRCVAGNRPPKLQTPGDLLDGDCQRAACLTLTGTPGQSPILEVDLHQARLEVPAYEFLGERVLDVALDGPTQRPRAVGPVAAGGVNNPIHHLG